MRGLVILSLVSLAACASSGAAPGERTREETIRMAGGGGGTGLRTATTTTAKVDLIPQPLEKVWLVLPIAYDTLGITVADFDAKTYTIGNKALKVRRRLGKTSLTRYLECGTTQIGPNAESYEITMTILTTVKPTTTGTSVASTVEAVGKPMAFAGDPVRCTSKGTLEEAIANVLKWKLGV